MPFCILLIFALNQTGDTLVKPLNEPVKSYNKEIIINAALGLGFGIGGGTFFMLGNKAYDNYKRSGSMESANKYFDQTVVYDNARNICAAGAIFFFARALYFQIKNNQAEKPVGLKPVFDLEMPAYAKIQIGLRKGI
jgi:hypothetical protein